MYWRFIGKRLHYWERGWRESTRDRERERENTSQRALALESVVYSQLSVLNSATCYVASTSMCFLIEKSLFSYYSQFLNPYNPYFWTDRSAGVLAFDSALCIRWQNVI